GGRVDPAARDAVRRAVGLLHDGGHAVEEVDLPWDGQEVADAYLLMYFGEVAAVCRRLQEVLGRAVRPGDVEDATFTMALLGESLAAADYASLARRWNAVARRFAAFHERYDLLLTPTTAHLPPRVGAHAPHGPELLAIRSLNGLRAGALLRRSGMVWAAARRNLEAVPYTQVANLCGLPAMSVPLHQTEAPLPVGVQFVGRFGAEDVLFRLAAQLEQQAPWFERRPPGFRR
ncbi:MAG: amidase family protein, partial [Catalinimonas sp.]